MIKWMRLHSILNVASFFVLYGFTVSKIWVYDKMSLRGMKWRSNPKFITSIFLTNKENGTLYTGVTNNLQRRIYEHKNKLVDGFTKKYSLDKLVYYEVCESIESAILREKQLKDGSRKKKLDLINKFNKKWQDLYETII